MALELRPGDTYDRFKILQVLRTYPNAWVYKVQSEQYDRPMALKLSLEPVRSEEVARRALREVAVLQQLTNTHVVKVHESGLGPNEHWFILSDHLEGAQLNHWHDFDRPLPAGDAVRFIHQACLGMAELHAEGIVHRDLKPERLWIEPDRTLKIMDFSSARSWGQDPTGDNVTVGMVVTGTPQYAAPEQLTTNALEPTADVYSLGVLLYEMLTGHSPFFAERPWSQIRRELADDPSTWLRAHATKSPVPITDHEPAADLPRNLVDLVHQTLHKNPAERPANAGALANALGWILHHELGAAQAAVVRILESEVRPRYYLLLPGSHRLGVGSDVEIAVGKDGDRLLATLEWAGAPKPAELAPQDDRLTLNGQPVTGRVPLNPGDRVRIGTCEIDLTYPS